MSEQDSRRFQSAVALEEAPDRSEQSDLSTLSFADVLLLIIRGKQLIGQATAIATILGIIVSLVLPPRYTAVTKIMTPRQTPSLTSLFLSQFATSGVSLAAASGGGLGLKSPNDLYIGLLNSRTVADAIIRKFELVSVYHAKDMTAARKKLARYTNIASEKSDLIAVSVSGRNKKRSAEMANAYTEQLYALTQSLAVTEASQRRLFFEEQLKRAKDDLVAAEFTFQHLQQKEGLVQLDAQAKELIAGVATLRAQVAAKQVELRALRSYSTDNNPTVQLAENQLQSLQGEVARLEQSGHVSGSSDIGMGNISGAGLEYLRAEHELQYRQTLFDLLVRQFDAARLDEAKEAAIIQVVEPAVEPERRSFPPRVLVILLFALGGLAAGCCAALFPTWKYRTPSGRSFVALKEDLSRRMAEPSK